MASSAEPMVFPAGSGKCNNVPSKPPDGDSVPTSKPSFKDKVIGSKSSDREKVRQNLLAENLKRVELEGENRLRPHSSFDDKLFHDLC
ncbi:hypothetical protein SESBI_48773 [Sesbania bispinosa]|nr:hypothetical protein SESBI_48773 [Sesbania bispinosa]